MEEMMGRYKGKVPAYKSERCLRTLINDNPELLQAELRQAFKWKKSEHIEWLSPLKSDDYAEYRDDAFLSRLGVEKLSLNRKKFWPDLGPQWDGLGRTSSERLILVEAKAHVAEAASKIDVVKADPATLKLRRKSLSAAKAFFKVDERISWEVPLYQHANRLAHLYYLAELNHLDAYLVYLYFSNVSDCKPDEVCSSGQWEAAIKAYKLALGIPKRFRLQNRIANIIFDAGRICG